VHRDELKAEVTDSGDQYVKGRLVCDWSAHHRDIPAIVPDLEAIEP
jgi:hypothetical protein